MQEGGIRHTLPAPCGRRVRLERRDCPHCGYEFEPIRRRTPKRENVRFYGTAAAAGSDGFRACLRCHPDRFI